MADQSQSEKGCRFCGNPFSISPKTEEHAPPKWLLEQAGVKRDEKHRLSERTPGHQYTVLRDIGAHSSVYGKVCDACNCGWLSDLENEMKAVFSKMTSGDCFTLTWEEARTASRWLHKTAALIALSNPGPRKHLILAQDLRAICDGKMPTGESDVIIGRTSAAAPSKLRIWTHSIRYGVPQGYSFEKETKDGKCFTAMLHYKNLLLGYIYRHPTAKWRTLMEPQDSEFLHVWPGHLVHELDMTSVSAIEDPEAIRFSFLLASTPSL